MNCGAASRGLEDFSGLQTTCADADSAGSAIDERAHNLQVRLEASFCAVICVRDTITELRTLTADFTTFCHHDLHRLVLLDG